MRFIIITINVLSIYAVQNNHIEDFIGELERIIEVLQVQLFIEPAIQAFPLKNNLHFKIY